MNNKINTKNKIDFYPSLIDLNLHEKIETGFESPPQSRSQSR